MDKPLVNQECVPCKEGAAPLTTEQIAELKPLLSSGWQVEADKKLIKTYSCSNFMRAVEFIQRLAGEAEKHGHHPDVSLHDFNQVTVQWWTHKIGGLHHNDFIMAAVTDEVAPQG